MKSLRIRHLVQYGLGIAVAMAMSLLFVNSKVELDEFRRVDADLGRLRENIAIIHQQLVELQAGSSRNYDRISAAASGLREGIDRLRQEQALKPVIGEVAAVEFQADLDLLWQNKFRAVEEFKAQNALHKNLIQYAPKNIEDFIMQLRQNRNLKPEDLQEVENLLNRVAVRMFIDHNLSLNDDLDVSGLLARAREEMTARLPEDLLSESSQLFGRLQLALRIEGQLFSALKASASSRLDDRIRELRELLRSRLDQEQLTARNYRIGLYLLGLLMLFYLARVFLRSQELSQHLESSLNELEFQKRALDEHSIVTITDVRGDILYANDRMCEISGYRRDELIGNNHRMLKSGKHDAEFYRNMWRDLVRKGKWQGEIVNRARNGRLYWLATTLLARYDERGKPWQYIGIRTDITEQKKMERDARLLARFPAENPDPVLRMGRNGRILYHNPASRVLLDHWAVREGHHLPAEWQAVLRHCLEKNRIESHDIHIG
ncbi:MAG TPA: PAS domain S-box protein, partial [Thiotrichales bacterium]|nr:PAS domain S-box protein [Thiotrichales bacterium]